MPSSPSSSEDDIPDNSARRTPPVDHHTRASSQQQRALGDSRTNSNHQDGTSREGDFRHRGAVVFLHGSGDTGPGVRQWLEAASGGEFERVLGSELGLKVGTSPSILLGGKSRAMEMLNEK